MTLLRNRRVRNSLLTFLFCLIPLYQSDGAQNIPALVKRISPSVVLIVTFDEQGKPITQGSGFFVGTKGQIVTNRHVIEGATSAAIRTAQGNEYQVTEINAEDMEADLVILATKTPGPEVRPLSPARTTPEVGEQILVIGCPLGLEGTVMEGLVSAVRKLPSGDIIQISAAISPGSSGSPVVNMKGELIGVATFQMLGGQGLNFAISSAYVKKLIVKAQNDNLNWPSNGKSQSNQEALSPFEEGRTHYWLGEYEQAIPFFRKAVEKDPGDSWSYYYLGDCYNFNGRFDDAIDAYQKSIKLNPDFSDAHCNLGVVYDAVGRRHEAIEEYKISIKLDPNSAVEHSNLGIDYHTLGLNDEAIDELKQAIRIDPNFAPAHNNLGTVYRDIGKTSDAIQEYMLAIKLEPNNSGTFRNLGILYYLEKRNNEAIEVFKQAIRINPNDSNAHFLLGLVYSDQGREKEAITEFQEVIRLDPNDVGAHVHLGISYGILGRNDDAILELKQALKIEPDNPSAHFWLGFAYVIAGDKSAALEEYKILKVIDKDKAEELFNEIYK